MLNFNTSDLILLRSLVYNDTENIKDSGVSNPIIDDRKRLMNKIDNELHLRRLNSFANVDKKKIEQLANEFTKEYEKDFIVIQKGKLYSLCEVERYVYDVKADGWVISE